MSERPPEWDDTVYGGTMSQESFYYNEFQIQEGLPDWDYPEVKAIKMNLTSSEGTETLHLHRLNTKIYDFNESDDGADFSWWSHIYIHRPNLKPFLMRRPEDEEGGEKWDKLAEMLIDIDCEYICGLPKEYDYDWMYEQLRGDEPIEDILQRMLDE